MKKFENPLRTNFLWSNEDDSSISILGETEKAVLLVVGYNRRKGTSLTSERVVFEKWVPKSVWNNENNFETTRFRGEGDYVTYFKPPYFLR